MGPSPVYIDIGWAPRSEGDGAACRREITPEEDRAVLVSGTVRSEVHIVPRRMSPALALIFRAAKSGDVLLEEEMPYVRGPGTRTYRAEGGALCHVETRFTAQDGERFDGLGQHQPHFERKGCVIDVVQADTEIPIPVFVSSSGYGLLWDIPGSVAPSLPPIGRAG